MTFEEFMYLLLVPAVLLMLCVGGWFLDEMGIDDGDWWLP